MAFNLPNLLTWQRILAIPLLVCVYLVPFDAWGEHSRNLVATILFILASITDWLDGWLARRLGQQTELGAFLDPVADKLLVCVALVMLLDLGRINAGIAIIIIGREILPNMASYLMIHFIFAMTGATYAMVGLYLLGLAPMTGINWGIMINNAWAKGALFFTNAAWSIMAPLLVVSVLQLSAIWFARTLEQLLNPRLAGKQQ